jgi:hypothetical protein
MNIAVFRQEVGDQDLVGMPVPEMRPTLSADVVGEQLFSRADIALARACADFTTVVEDDPYSFPPSRSLR